MHKILLTLIALFITICIPSISNASCVTKDNVMTCTNLQTGEVTTMNVEPGTEESGVLEGCPPVAQKLSEFAKCVMCPMFRTIYDTANELIRKSFNALATPLRNIMSIVFAILIAIKTLAHVSSFTQTNGSDFIDDLFKQSFKFFISFTFLTIYNDIFYYVFNPILTAGIDMGSGFLSNTQSLANITPPQNVSGDFFSGEVYTNIEVFSQRAQQELAFMQAIGSSLMCISFNSASTWGFIPDGSLLISGLIMYVFAVAISVAFGYYLIDGMLQLCVVGIMTPFSLASYPFNFSQKWMKTTWDAFLDTFFKFVFMGLVISLIVEIMAFAVAGGEGGYNKILDAMNGNNTETIENLYDITSVGFITFCVCCIFGAQLTQKATDLAATMSGGSMVTAGGDLGGLAMNAITTPIKKVVGQNLTKAKEKVGAGAKKFGSNVKAKANKMMSKGKGG